MGRFLRHLIRPLVVATVVGALALPALTFASGTGTLTASATVPTVSGDLYTYTGAQVTSLAFTATAGSSQKLSDGTGGYYYFNDQTSNSTYGLTTYDTNFGASDAIPGAGLTITCVGAATQLNSTAVTDSAAAFSPSGVAETTTSTSPVTVAATVDSANPYLLLTFTLNVPGTTSAGSYSNSVTLVGS